MTSWRRTADRDNRPWYAAPDGSLIARDGYGRMRWTVYYPDTTYGMTDTLAEAKEWANARAAVTCEECGDDRPTQGHHVCADCIEKAGDLCHGQPTAS